jgi:hypothetical protein
MWKTIKKVVGGMITLFGFIRWLPDILESTLATQKYGLWLYKHIGVFLVIPPGKLVTLTILIIGIGLIFSETIQEEIRKLRNRKLAPSTGGNSFSMKTESKTLPDGGAVFEGSLSRSIDVSQLQGARIVDRGSGEDRKRAYERRPKLFLEYDAAVAAKYSMSASGVFLKNTGGTAHNVHFDPEVRAGLTLEMDDPPGSIDGTPYPVTFRFCTVRTGKRSVVTGPLAQRMQSLFLALLLEGEQVFEVGIRCTDFEGNNFSSKTRFKYDDASHHISSEVVV